MRHGNDRTRILLQVLFEPVYGFGIQVVGRFVEQQDVGLLQKQAAKSYTSALSTGKIGHRLVGRRTTQGIHRTLKFAVEVPGIGGVDDILQFGLTGKQGIHLVLVLIIFGQSELLIDFLIFGQCVDYVLHTFHDHFLHGLCVIQLRLLGQIAYTVSGRKYDLALIALIQPGDNFQKGGLS